MAVRIALAPPKIPKALRRPRKPVGPPPTALERSAAAGELAKRERPKVNKWVGCFRGKRIRRGTMFRLINGEVRTALAIRGGKIYFLAPVGSERIIDEIDLCNVSRVKNPGAVTLGRAKRGVKELKSAAKAASAQRNGCQPPRRGSRPRGRPPRPATAAPAQAGMPKA